MATYRLQISMKDADPEISRVVDVPTFACFNDLHSIIQSVMGWMDMEGHLFEKDDIIIGPFEEDVNVFDDLKVPISDYEGIGLTYIYGNEGDREVDIRWLGPGDDLQYDHMPQLVSWKGDNPPVEDFRPDDVGTEFDEARVTNSLESWGVQGPCDEGVTYLSHGLRMDMVLHLTVMFEGPIVYDTEECDIKIITDGPASIYSSPVVRRTVIESDPDRYIIVDDDLDKVSLDAYCILRGRHPGLPELPSFANTNKAISWIHTTLDENCMMEEYEGIVVIGISNSLFTWAKDNGFYFFGSDPQSSGRMMSMEEEEEMIKEYLTSQGVDIEDPDSIIRFMMGRTED